jgi:hypothetical protein
MQSNFIELHRRKSITYIECNPMTSHFSPRNTVIQALEKVHADVQLDGVHCDAMFDIAAKSKTPHPVEQRVAEWLDTTLKLSGNM